MNATFEEQKKKALVMKQVGLKERLNQSLTQKLSRIEEVCENLWKKDAFGHIHYTIHGIPHSRRVTSTLDTLLFNWMNTPYALNQTEIFLLLSSVPLHDIGMLLGKKGENPEDVRKNHEVRGFNYIKEEHNRLSLGLNEAEAELIALLVKAHRKVPHKEAEYDDTQILDDRIRLRFSSAVLRLADELDITYLRAPSPLRDLLQTHLPDYSYLEWMRHLYTTGVQINQNKITYPVVVAGIESLQMQLSPIQITIYAHFPSLEYIDLIGKRLILDPVQKAVFDVYPMFVENFLPITPEVNLKTRIDKHLTTVPNQILQRWRRRIQLSEALFDIIRYYYTRVYKYEGATGRKHPIYGHDLIRVRSEISYSSLNISSTPKWLAGNGVFLTLELEAVDLIDQVGEIDVPRYVTDNMRLEFYFRSAEELKRKRMRTEFIPLESELLKLSAEEIIMGAQLDVFKPTFQDTVFIFHKLSKTNVISPIISIRTFYALPILPETMLHIAYNFSLILESENVFVNHLPHRTKGLAMRFEDFPDNYEFFAIRNLLYEEEGFEKPRILDYGMTTDRHIQTPRLLSPGSLVVTVWRGKEST